MNPSEFDNLIREERDFWWFRGMDASVEAVLLRHWRPQPHHRILDAGCGTGRSSVNLIRTYGCRVDSLDLDHRGLSFARAQGQPRALQADIRHLPLRSASYDAVLNLDALPHMNPGEEHLPVREFFRVLRPGGWLILRTAALDILRSRHSQFVHERQRFRRSQLLRLGVEAGFETHYCGYANSLLLPIALAKFRVWEPLTRSAPASGVQRVPHLLNECLARVLRFETAWLARGGRFPLGQSLIWIAQRPPRQAARQTES